MAKKKYQASGQVIDRKTKRGVPGLRVEAWDKDEKYNDFLGVAITDRSGCFQMSFDETYFREYAPDTSPDLFFKIYRGQRLLLKSTEDSVLWNAKTTTKVKIEVELPSPSCPSMLEPQQYAPPSTTAQVWEEPTATAVAPSDGPSAWTGSPPSTVGL